MATSEALAVLIGAVPGLTVSALINYLKFRQFSPFSMGDGAGVPVYLVAGITVLIVAAWVLTRQRHQDFAHRHRRTIFLAAIVLGLGVVAGTQSLVPARKVIADLCFWLADTRILDAGIGLPAMERTPAGGVVYIGALKKALLQSLPFLVLLVVPITNIVRREKDFAALAILFVPPVSFIGFYSCLPYTLHQYGGLCLNHRYFTSILPFLAILCAYGVKDLKSRGARHLVSQQGR